MSFSFFPEMHRQKKHISSGKKEEMVYLFFYPNGDCTKMTGYQQSLFTLYVSDNVICMVFLSPQSQREKLLSAVLIPT